MESVGQTMSHMNRARQFNYEDLVVQILADQEVAAFIKDQSLSEQEIRRSISKFNQYISERNRFLLGDPDYIAKGYKPILTMNEGYADVAYEENARVNRAQKRAAINQTSQLDQSPFNLERSESSQGRSPLIFRIVGHKIS